MNELLCHLIGDYILQPHWMANKKTSDLGVALMHGVLYSIPFMFLTNNLSAYLIIVLTHTVIDRYRLANCIAKIKNNIWNTPNGYPEETPPWVSVWLMIITDNTMHMIINHFALMLKI